MTAPDTIKTNQILQADAMVALSMLPDNFAHMLLTDLPYGKVNRSSHGLRNLDKGDADVFDLDMEELVPELIRVTSGSLYVFCGTEQVSTIRHIMVESGLSTRLGIWEKTNPSPMNGQHLWLSGIECCVYGKKAKATFNASCKNSVWRFPTQRSKIHPTQKPEKLFEYLIETSSNEGDIVLDPFIGSGTTAVTAKRLSRQYLGFDLNQNYVDLANDRVKNDGS